MLRRLRDEAPLYYNERYDFYALSRYDDVERALKDKDTFVNGKGNVLELIKADVEQPPGTLIFEDPPAHTLHRKLLSRAFTPKRVAALEPQIRDVHRRLPRPARRRGRVRLRRRPRRPGAHAGDRDAHGHPEEDRQTVREHVDGYLRTEPGKPMRFSKGSKWTRVEAADIFGEYIDWRAEHPSDDVMTELLYGGVRGRARRDPHA